MSKRSPFKFLDPYELKDKAIFFGRDEEIERLYEMVFETNILLVYGPSGSGKTSLIQCGLAAQFKRTDWFEIFIRRRDNINQSLKQAMVERARTELPDGASLSERVESLFLDYFKPIYLIFDQFEELYILGDEKERAHFIQQIAELVESDLNCKIIIVMREEYIAQLYDFEKQVPQLFEKRLRVEPMNFTNVATVIKGTTSQFNILLEDQEDTIQRIIENISDQKSGVQLSYLQVYLDRLYREAQGS
jgi:AAA+ ATPase superfamily predicted ATPase